MHFEYFDGHAAGPGFGVRLEEDGFVGVAGGDLVGAGAREEALGEVGREIGGDRQSAFY